MNSNSSTHSHDNELRQAVEQQLDLILKMQEQRKALKKQNKLLHNKLKESIKFVEKYQRETKSIETNTEVGERDGMEEGDRNEEKIEKRVEGKEIAVQIDMDLLNGSNTSMNCSKLQQAQSLLKVLDIYGHQSQQTEKEQSYDSKRHRRQKSISKQRQNQKQKQKSKQKQKAAKPASHHNSQLAAEMVKLTKQLNLAKKELKDIEHKYKLRDKEIKDLKKCIETKNQALEKSRKEFNQLSVLMNSDRYKSVRTLEQEVQALKAKQAGEGDTSKLKNLLTQLSQQYEGYRKQSQRKIEILVSELASKQKQIESLKRELRNSVLRQI